MSTELIFCEKIDPVSRLNVDRAPPCMSTARNAIIIIRFSEAVKYHKLTYSGQGIWGQAGSTVIIQPLEKKTREKKD